MKHIIIIGKGFGWQAAPPLSKEYETWGINDIIFWRPVDMSFTMDTREFFRNYSVQKNAIFHLICQASFDRKIPLMISDGDDDDYAPAQEWIRHYPLEEVVDEVGMAYFNSTVDYMLAYAIYIGVEKLDLYGINFAHESEYLIQRPSSEYWIGVARGRGMEVAAHGEYTKLFQLTTGKLYGYNKTYEEILGE
jgi:hypothetical protein